MEMKEKNSFGLVIVSLTKARTRRIGEKAILIIRDNLNSYIKESQFLKEASFNKIVLSLRYGLKNDKKPGYQRINKKYEELPVYIEIDTHTLLQHKEDEIELYRILYLPCLITLSDISKKYNLDGSYFEAELEKLNKGEIAYQTW